MRLVALLAGAWVLTNEFCSLGRTELADLVRSLMGISRSTYCGMDTLLALEGSHFLLSTLNLLRVPSPNFCPVACYAAPSGSAPGQLHSEWADQWFSHRL